MPKISLGAGALLSPVPPTIVSCGTLEDPKALTIAWTGIVNTKPPMTYISVRPERNSYPIIKETGNFVINLASTSLTKAVDYCGVKSGAKVDKFKEMHLTAVPSLNVSAPSIEECPVSIECVVREIMSLGSHDMFLAEIVGITADEEICDENGKFDFRKADLLAYMHGEYFGLGKKYGSFGYSVRKKSKKKPHKKK